MAYNYLQDMPKQGSMDSLIQGYDIGQKYRQNQILQNDNKALADILRGDVGALSRLQSPELIQKAQNHLRELEQRKALQGFYTPATKDQYQANVTQNPIAAIMDGGKKPSNLVQAQQPSYQESQAPTMLDMLQTGKIASGKPASYDFEGAGNYLLGQANFEQLGKLTDYRKAIAKDEAEWGTNPTKGINPSTGLADSYITDRKGNIKWLGSGVYEAPKEARPVPVMRNGRPVTVQVPGTNEVKILMSDNTYSSGGSIPAPPAPEKPMSGYQKIKLEGELRDDYRKDSANFVEISRQAKIIESSLNDDSAAGTLASATAFMKMLDPGSVVRESELAMAMKTNGALDRMSNYINVIQSGQVLTKQQKADFAKLIKAYSNASNEAQRNLNKKYGQISSEYGLDPKRVAVYDVEKDDEKRIQSKQDEYKEYVLERGKAYKSGNYDLVRQMDAMAKQDGLIK